MVEINLDTWGARIADTNDKILLLDADTLAYAACLSAEVEEQLLPRDMYTTNEWEDLMESGVHDESSGTLFHTPPDTALSYARDKLDRILQSTGCIAAEMYFTAGKTNFRYLLNPEYKANRKGRTPHGLQELKETLHSMYPGEIGTKVEADDLVIHKYNPDIHILAAVDKDVIYSVPGRHWNYYESGLYNIDMKWVDVDEERAMKHPYHQTLMGDTTDNIKSPRGIGAKTATKILKHCTTPEECWKAVVKAYKEKKWTEEDALLVMRQVNLHQMTDDGGLKLWTS